MGKTRLSFFTAYRLLTSKSSLQNKCTLFQLWNGMLILIICLVYRREKKYIYVSAWATDSVPGHSSLNSAVAQIRSRRYCNESELSKYIWKLKDNNTNFILKWSIASFASPYKCGTRKCDLCLSEKVAIVRADPKFLLNKRTELVSKCRHLEISSYCTMWSNELPLKGIL